MKFYVLRCGKLLRRKMETDFENEGNVLTDDTRRKLKDLSKAMIRLHATLLDAARNEYEAKNGQISSIGLYFQLVIDDPHFSWLRKISSLIALIDEATSLRRPASETESRALLDAARTLLSFEDADENFNEKFQTALLKNPDAVLGQNDALALAKR